MLTIRVPNAVCHTLCRACRSAKLKEIGGMLFGEHVAEDDFRVLEATVSDPGTQSSFLRELVPALKRLKRFFRQTKRNYTKFNYLGEWHSHPLFPLTPSWTDDTSMLEIVRDPQTGARFAVLLIVSSDGDDLLARGFLYRSVGPREDVLISLRTA